MLIDFLKTTRSKEDLKIALEIIREFKACESNEEWLAVQFACWVKFEQLEEYLAYLVDGDLLANDTLECIANNI